MHVYRFMERPAPWRTKDRIETLFLKRIIFTNTRAYLRTFTPPAKIAGVLSELFATRKFKLKKPFKQLKRLLLVSGLKDSKQN